MAAIAERLPTLLPFLHRVLQCARKVGVVTLVRLNSLLRPLELHVDLLQVSPLDEGALGGVRVDTHAVPFVLLSSPRDVALLSLFGLELLFNLCLNTPLM